MGAGMSVSAPRGAGAFALRLIRTTPHTPKGVVVRGCGKRRIPPSAPLRTSPCEGADQPHARRQFYLRRDFHQDYQET